MVVGAPRGVVFSESTKSFGAALDQWRQLRTLKSVRSCVSRERTVPCVLRYHQPIFLPSSSDLKIIPGVYQIMAKLGRELPGWLIIELVAAIYLSADRFERHRIEWSRDVGVIRAKCAVLELGGDWAEESDASLGRAQVVMAVVANLVTVRVDNRSGSIASKERETVWRRLRRIPIYHGVVFINDLRLILAEFDVIDDTT